MERERIVVIVGPTASGKSALGVVLARKFKGEVISADSRQVYKGLNIGTGKITKREMRGIPHHLLDVASPRKKFSAGDFARLARASITSVGAAKKVPFIVGGTGFYIDSLVGRINMPDVSPNQKLRAQLQKKTPAQLFTLLKMRDAKRAKIMDTPSERNNKVRLIRALEIAAAKPRKAAPTHAYDVLWLGIAPAFSALEKRINKRLKDRLRGGMIAEAKQLRKAELSYKRMEELGLEYRSLAGFLQGKLSKQEMETELRRDIRRYAKKQLGYWKRNKEIQWFDPKDSKRVETVVRKWLSTSPYVSAARAR